MNLDLNEIRAGKTAFAQSGSAGTYQLEGLDGRFPHPVKVAVTVSRSDGTILASGTISTEVGYACSRCLAEFSRHLRVTFKVLCVPEGRQPETEEESITYNPQDAQIDLTGFIREQIILSLPVKPLCREDCAGLCAGCGVNLSRQPCQCPAAPPDPRWNQLKKILPS
jgi:uncharacterized protein